LSLQNQADLPPPPVLSAADPALEAVRALVSAADLPMGVFDADGECLVANRPFVLHAARYGAGPAREGSERRTVFSPDGVRQWVIVSPGDSVSQRPVAGFIDAVANALPLMFNAKDTASRYLFMNRYQAALYGTSPEEAVGRTAAELLGPEYGSYTRAIDAEVIRTGRATPFFEESYAAADGTRGDWLTSKVPLTREDGTVWGVATVALDITERKRLQDSLLRAKEEAEAANRAKASFLARMNHEFRTPLNAVIGFGEMLASEMLGPLGDPEYRDYAGHILSSGQHLLGLITDLLDYARIEAGTLALVPREMDAGRMLQGVLAQLGPQAKAAEVALVAELPGPDARVVLRADENRLRQVMLAVLGNAIKFSHAGGNVRIQLTAPPESGLLVVVEDSGPGIAPADLDRVFDPFWQADSGLGRRREGVGIGLPLARELVRLHGGKLELQSSLGTGTQVTLLLPPAPPTEEDPA
jgi:PAS domain S-box-containing protein